MLAGSIQRSEAFTSIQSEIVKGEVALVKKDDDEKPLDGVLVLEAKE